MTETVPDDSYFLTVELTAQQGRAFAALLARSSYGDDPEEFAAKLLMRGVFQMNAELDAELAHVKAWEDSLTEDEKRRATEDNDLPF